MTSRISDELKWIFDTQYQSIITWFASSLAVFIGMIELLPEITTDSLTSLKIPLAIIYVILLVVGSISIYRVLRLTEERVRMEQEKLPEDLRPTFWIQKNPVLRFLFVRTDRYRNFRGLKWYVYFLLFVWAALWVTVLLLKLGVAIPFYRN
ncbi:MAG: hypothetical protein ACE5NN_03965 [Candidatus Bathyarchaeia archaeon]